MEASPRFTPLSFSESRISRKAMPQSFFPPTSKSSRRTSSRIAAQIPGKVDSLVSKKKRVHLLGLFSGLGLLLMPIFSRLAAMLAAEGTKAGEVLTPFRAANESLYHFFASFERFNGWVTSVWQLVATYLLPALAVRYVGYFLGRPLYALPLMFSLILAIWWGNRTQRAIYERAQQAWSSQ